MALAGIAPTEKTEHFIYAILPMTLALFVAKSLAGPETSLIEFLTFTGIASSILTLLLYEIRLDEYLVKVWARWLPGNEPHFTERDYLELAILSWNLFLKTWVNIEINPPELQEGGWSLGQQIDKFTQSVVSSPIVRRRLWPIRASFYIFWALPFIIWLLIVSAVESGWMSSLPLISTLWSILSFWNSSPILILTLGLWIVVGGVVFFINKRRHRHLKSHIHILVVFRYVQRLVMLESKPDHDRPPSNKKLDFLQEVINMNDWPTFVDIWNPFRVRVEITARDKFIPGIGQNLWSHWSSCVRGDKNYDRNRATREELTLGWFVYLSHQLYERVPKVNGTCKKLIEFANQLYEEDAQYRVEKRVSRVREALQTVKKLFISHRKERNRISIKERLLRGLSNPLYIFARAPQDLLDDCESSLAYNIWTWTYGLIETKISEALQSKILARVQAEKDKPYNMEKVSQQILNLMHVCYDEGKTTDLLFFPDRYHGENAFHTNLLRKLKEWDNKGELGYMVALYMLEGNTKSRISILEDLEWRSHLVKGPARVTLEKIRDGTLQTDSNFVQALKESDLFQ